MTTLNEVSYVSQAAFARSCGVSRQRIHQAIQEGLVIKAKRGIDPDNPVNEYYRQKALAGAAQRKAYKPGEAVVPVVTGEPPEEPPGEKVENKEPKRKKAPSKPVQNNNEVLMDISQKVYEDTRLRKIKADTAVLLYAEKVGAIVDNETLRRKMGAFADFLFNHLVYLPEEIADILWAKASSSDDPEAEIRDVLSEKIAEVIKAAKDAAREVQPPKDELKYVMLGLKDNEIFGDQAGTGSEA